MTAGAFFVQQVNLTTKSFSILIQFFFSELTLSKNLNKQSYLFFMNSSEVHNYQGLVGLGVRELKYDEIDQYCPNSKPLTPPYIEIDNNSTTNGTNGTNVYSTSLTTDFYYLSFFSGCYYMDVATGKWSSYGVEVMNDTSILYTHCKTSHLTTFAGGWIVLPSTINFNYVFANASFEKNKTIILTVSILLALYLLFAIWGRYMDRKDLLKIGVAPLIDNQPGDSYYYEIIVFTCQRKDAGTDSNVIDFFYFFDFSN